jgi:hypothetical protein
MCEICSSDCFTICADCSRRTAFAPCHPDYITCSNSEKGATCTELSASMAAAADSSIDSRDCARCGPYCDCNNPTRYSCVDTGYVSMDDYDSGDDNCCEPCNTKLYYLRKKLEYQENVDCLEDLSNQLPTLKAELAILEAELPEKMRSGLEKFKMLDESMRELAVTVFTQSLNAKKDGNIYRMVTETKRLAEIVSQLANCTTKLHTPEYLVSSMQERVKETESKISRLSLRIASYRTAQIHSTQIHPV